MNKHRFDSKKTLFAISLVVLSITATLIFAFDTDDSSADVFDTFNDGKFYYSITSEEDNEVSIIGTMMTAGNISMPSSVEHDGKTYSITSIGSNAFLSQSGLTGTLTIPDSVTDIGSYAFFECSGFTGSLIIPDSVTNIGFYAFCKCSGLDGSLVIPESVTTLGQGAFSGCDGLTGSLTIPGSIEVIDNFAFDGCSGFTGTLDISAGVKTIGISSFEDCAGFTSLIIPWSVNVIETDAFEDCTGLTYISISSNPTWTDIMGDVFSGITFYNETGTTVLEQTKANLCRYTFSGTYEEMIRGGPIEIDSIFFDVNGGSSDGPIQPDVAKGGTFVIPSYSGTKTGYAFNGWNDGTATYAVGSTYTTGSSDVYLTAVWVVADNNPDNDASNTSKDWTVYIIAAIIVIIAICLIAYYYLKIRKTT